MLQKIKEAYEARDLEALDAMAVPTYREQYKSNDFRSALMLSCHNIKHLEKIASLEAECIILNLEDGVADQEKPFALALCALYLSRHKKLDKKLVVRINALNEGGYEELTYLNQFRPDAIRVPKIKTQKEVLDLLHLLHEDIELHLSIETAQGWNNLASLAPNKRVSAFYLGILDLFADMKLPQSLISPKNPTLHYILAHFLITTKALGVKPVSFAFQEYKNTQHFEEWLILEKQLGFDAKMCITPNQVHMVNDIFRDEARELARAEVIVKLFEMHKDEGVTGFVDDEYGFIDEPIYKGALALLDKAKKGVS